MLLSWSPELLCLTARRFHSARGLSPSPAAQCQRRWDSEVQPRLGLGQSQGDLEPRSCPLPGMRPVPLQPQMLAKLLLYSQCWGLPRVPVHQLSDCCSAGGRREALPAHFTACVWPSFPFPPGLDPKPTLLARASTPGPPVWGPILCPAPEFAPLLLGLRLPAITALSGQPGWMRLSNLGAGWLVLGFWC